MTAASSLSYLVKKSAATARPLFLLTEEQLRQKITSQPAVIKNWVNAQKFKAAAGTHIVLPNEDGHPEQVWAGIEAPNELFAYAHLSRSLPEGTYEVKSPLTNEQATLLCTAWGLNSYVFDRYKKSDQKFSHLVIPSHARMDRVAALVEATTLVRDLINTPAVDMGPAALADAARALAQKFKAKFKVTVGDELLKKGYRGIHVVGKSSDEAPRLIDLVWGNKSHPKLTLVGKGVCFDTGGVNLKGEQFMKYMKKDMGGAAHVLGLAMMVMMLKLPVRLRVLVPAVENLVSERAMLPMDVFKTYKGLTVEVAHTDAEGRLILADALWLASEEKPDLLIDFATLTGAARSGLGTDIPALFANTQKLAEKVMLASEQTEDPLWPLPLHKGYAKLIEGQVADLTNSTDTPYGGAITAALFLQHFVGEKIDWMHVDLMGFNFAARPGKPKGGDAQGLRAFYRFFEDRYVGKTKSLRVTGK